MEYEFLTDFLANHGILMEMFLQDVVRTCALIAFLGGMFLGYLVVKTRGGIAWKEKIVWPKTKM